MAKRKYVFNSKLISTDSYEISWEEIAIPEGEICKTTVKLSGPPEAIEAAIYLAAKQLRDNFSDRFKQDTDDELARMGGMI